MDKPVPSWLIVLTIIILIAVSFGIYLWLKSINIENTKKEDNEFNNIKKST